MIKFETDKELIQLQECWFRYGEVLQLTAQKFIQECYESQTLKQTEYETLRQAPSQTETSSAVRARVSLARETQKTRFKNETTISNSDMNTKQLKRFTVISPESDEVMKKAVTRFALSARSCTRILKVARTIADLAGSKHIATDHISEALQYRPQFEM